MGTRIHSPEAAARVPAQSAPAPEQAAGQSVPDEEGSELAVQLDELDRCLARMDAVVSMLEADLARRVETWRALTSEIVAGFVDPPEPAKAPRRRRRRPAPARRAQARRGL